MAPREDDHLTELHRLITGAAQRSTIGYLSRSAEKAGEEMAQEIIRDPEWRKEIQTIIHGGVRYTLEALQAPAGDLAYEVRELRERIGRLETMLAAVLKRTNGGER